MPQHLYLCNQEGCRKEAAFYHIPQGLMYCRDCQKVVRRLDSWAAVDVVKTTLKCYRCRALPGCCHSPDCSSVLCEHCRSDFPEVLTSHFEPGAETIKTAVVVDISSNTDSAPYNILPLVDTACSLGWSGNAIVAVCWKNESARLLYLQIEPCPVNDQHSLSELALTKTALRAVEEEAAIWKRRHEQALNSEKQFEELWKSAVNEGNALLLKVCVLTTELEQANLQIAHLLGETKDESVQPVLIEPDFGNDRE